MGKITTTNTSSTTVVNEGISDSAHKQWMTKKNDKIADLEQQLEKEKEKNKRLRRENKELKQ